MMNVSVHQHLVHSANPQQSVPTKSYQLDSTCNRSISTPHAPFFQILMLYGCLAADFVRALSRSTRKTAPLIVELVPHPQSKIFNDSCWGVLGQKDARQPTIFAIAIDFEARSTGMDTLHIVDEKHGPGSGWYFIGVIVQADL